MLCKMEKAIYGLKTIRSVLLENTFKRGGADQFVYVKRTCYGLIYICLYVEKFIIAVKTSDKIYEVKETLKKDFKIKEFGLETFTGNENGKRQERRSAHDQANTVHR
uniref:Putative polyprotein n=1 Tax=Albugo laibachii Nc14 TaxID=890382 RepID=F0WND4_9STRA|nr:putative polyprotein [Albugo laibachii Nc14]|eukprot:CCA22825.1 putative polyprotein [Albugo laibachii Nc14]